MNHPTEHLMTVERTARYFTLGQSSPKTKTVWFALHGYGQLAAYFIRKFNHIADEHTFIVAPEGISRFYLDDSYERIGASWTTREHRDLEAEEYAEFLNEVYDEIMQGIDNESVEVNILGFSQGCATALRWLNNGHIQCRRLILWAGFFSNGIREMIEPDKLSATETVYVYGTKDPFFLKYPDIAAVFRQQMTETIDPKIISFDGTHRVDEAVLKNIIDTWN